MADRSSFDIGDAIKRLRELRSRFVVDQVEAAYENTARLIDRTWPLQIAQMDRSKIYLHLYKPNKKAANQHREQQLRIQSAMLAKLALPVWGYNRDTPKDTETRLAELEHDMEMLTEDGLLPHERRLPQKMISPISSETLRHNKSLLPKQRAQLFAGGLAVPEICEKRMGRKRVQPISRKDRLRRTFFLRSREEWRPSVLFDVCEELHGVVKWIDAQEPGDRDVARYAERYREADVRLSESKLTPTTFAVRLAIAIASADHVAIGTDQYAPNDVVAVSASYLYGQFVRAIKAEPILTRRGATVALFNKLLNYKDE